MNSYSEEEKLIRWYLLGAVSPEEEEQVEQRSQQDEEYGEQLLLAEEDLIDDYARGAMPECERDLFEQNFLTTPERRKKMVMAQAAVKYSAMHPPEEIVKDVPKWWQTLFVPFWKITVYAVLVLGIGFGIWRMNSSDSDVAVATTVMSQAYRVQRPLEARITSFDYAPFPKTMGNSQDEFDYVALDRAERILIDAVAEHPTVEAQHALGRLYLAGKKFDQAEKLFNAALQVAPNNARLHSDLGATLFEKWDRAHSAGQTAESEELKRRSLEHLEKALALDDSLREARFNLALLYQASDQAPLARAEWEKYLAIEPDSRGKKEAERNLELLK